MKWLTTIILLGLNGSALASEEEISSRLQEEFYRLRAYVQTLTPDKEYPHTGLKFIDDHEISWKLARWEGDPEVIHIMRLIDRRNSFHITYRLSNMILRDRTVIRRSIGPAFHGWRMHTIDADTGEYLGTQGAWSPHTAPRDEEILKQWDVKTFPRRIGRN